MRRKAVVDVRRLFFPLDRFRRSGGRGPAAGRRRSASVGRSVGPDMQRPCGACLLGRRRGGGRSSVQPDEEVSPTVTTRRQQARRIVHRTKIADDGAGSKGKSGHCPVPQTNFFECNWDEKLVSVRWFYVKNCI